MITTVRFDEVARYATKSGKCRCSKRRQRRQKFWQTLSPFNAVNGVPKTREQIVAELQEQIKAWMAEPITCDDCK
jgi:NAD(P)H-dependent flavin oxidoreductase YrpB (nitropropane dioxygenase family)